MNNTWGALDRRKAERYQAALPVELTQGTGITRNLSACGVFFETDCAFCTGEVIEFTLVLEYLDPGRPVRLQCRGRVVRVDQHGRIMGVAVEITDYRFNRRAGTRLRCYSRAVYR
jgi:hypothetical protein